MSFLDWIEGTTEDGIEGTTEDEPELKPVKAGYQTIGLCFFCCRAIESMQPGGTATRHVETKIPYGECVNALNR